MASSKGFVVIRQAKAEDLSARAELIRESYSSYVNEAFFQFLFQEAVLQCVVLSGAILFIFCGVSVQGCLLVLPVSAIVMYICVKVTHSVHADSCVQKLSKERIGWVAELHSGLLADPKTLELTIHQDALHSDDKNGYNLHKKVIGTVSLADFWGPKDSVWLHALAVNQQYVRRGVGRSLVARCVSWAADEGVESVEALTSQIQHPAANLLHNSSWEARGSYHRKLCGGVFSIMYTLHGKDLPHA